jgi:GTPase
MDRYRIIRPEIVPERAVPTIEPSSPIPSHPSYIRNPVPLAAKSFIASSEPIRQPSEPRRLRVALIGAPNAGKTSFLNTLLGEPVGAVSAKKNTTRESIEGIVTRDNFQFEFVDCPGIVPVNQSDEAKDLSGEAWRVFNSSDCALVIVDTVKRPDKDFLGMLRKLSPRQSIVDELEEFRDSHERTKTTKNIILVLNKMDLVEDRKWLKVRNMQLSQHANFSNSFYISAKQNRGLRQILECLKTIAEPGQWQYPSDTVTLLPRVGQVEQLVRAFLFTWFNKDVPYSIQQRTVGWTERLDGSLVIEHELLVKDSVVARMVVGSRARLIQRLKEHVSYKLQKKWNISKIIFLVHVKAKTQRVSKRDREAPESSKRIGLFSRGAGA